MDKKIIPPGREKDKLTTFSYKLFSELKKYGQCHPEEEVEACLLLRDNKGGASFLIGVCDDQAYYDNLAKELLECASQNGEMLKLLKAILNRFENTMYSINKIKES